MMSEISRILLGWYSANKRELPWRATRDPYKIWVSEIILQQTRVAQGIAYYFKFLEKFPDIFSLANASEQEILKIWQGLGYYSRARNMHLAAKQIISDYNGQFPQNSSELKKLKGIGDYTAAAIASFAFNEPSPVLDGNVYRLISRLFDIVEPVNTPKAKKVFTEILQELIPHANPSDFNQAIMEYGSVQCQPTPLCNKCELTTHCQAFKSKTISLRPVKKEKSKPKARFFNYLVIGEGSYMLVKRTSKDIWQSLFEFPLIESSEKLSWDKLSTGKQFLTLAGDNAFLLSSESTIHKLSHQTVHATFWKIKSEKALDSKDIVMVQEEDLNLYPVPKLIESYLKSEV